MESLPAPALSAVEGAKGDKEGFPVMSSSSLSGPPIESLPPAHPLPRRERMDVRGDLRCPLPLKQCPLPSP
ncbi:MAG: hypothetical protein AABY87_13355 [bacterium]